MTSGEQEKIVPVTGSGAFDQSALLPTTFLRKAFLPIYRVWNILTRESHRTLGGICRGPSHLDSDDTTERTSRVGVGNFDEADTGLTGNCTSASSASWNGDLERLFDDQ